MSDDSIEAVMGLCGLAACVIGFGLWMQSWAAGVALLGGIMFVCMMRRP